MFGCACFCAWVLVNVGIGVWYLVLRGEGEVFIEEELVEEGWRLVLVRVLLARSDALGRGVWTALGATLLLQRLWATCRGSRHTGL